MCVGIFFSSICLLYLLQKYIWYRAAYYAARTSTTVDDLLLERLKNPVRLLTIVLSASGAWAFSPVVTKHQVAIAHGIKIAAIICLIWIVDRLISVFFSSSASGNLSYSTRSLLFTIARVLFLLLGSLVVLDTLGISITPILASLGIGSLAVALALQDTLSNFFSGIYLLADKPIRVGDFVEIEDTVSGTVAKIGWRNTQVRTVTNNTVILPNSKVSSARIVNFDFPDKELTFNIPVGVAYDSDLNRVEKITIEVGKEILTSVQGGVAEFLPIIRFNQFSDSSINFIVILRGQRFEDQGLLKHEFIKRLHDRYKKEGIDIPFPQRVVHQAQFIK